MTYLFYSIKNSSRTRVKGLYCLENDMRVNLYYPSRNDLLRFGAVEVMPPPPKRNEKQRTEDLDLRRYIAGEDNVFVSHRLRKNLEIRWLGGWQSKQQTAYANEEGRHINIFYCADRTAYENPLGVLVADDVYGLSISDAVKERLRTHYGYGVKRCQTVCGPYAANKYANLLLIRGVMLPQTLENAIINFLKTGTNERTFVL